MMKKYKETQLTQLENLPKFLGNNKYHGEWRDRYSHKIEGVPIYTLLTRMFKNWEGKPFDEFYSIISKTPALKQEVKSWYKLRLIKNKEGNLEVNSPWSYRRKKIYPVKKILTDRFEIVAFYNSDVKMSENQIWYYGNPIAEFNYAPNHHITKRIEAYAKTKRRALKKERKKSRAELWEYVLKTRKEESKLKTL